MPPTSDPARHLRTRLIFHLMPAAPSLGAAFTFRWRTGVLIITTTTALLLARAGHFLDGQPLVAAIALAGAAMSGLWLRAR